MWWSMPETGEQPAPASPVRLLAVAGSVQRRQRTVLTLLATRDVRPCAAQPRKYFDEEGLAELSESIKTHGLLQPVVVRRVQDGFELLAGERRFRAAKLAGMTHIPALVRQVEDPLEIALIENLQREDLTPLEEAEALAQLIERHGYSHRQVADILGKSRPYVSNMLALTRLSPAIKGEVHRAGRQVPRELLMGVAREGDPQAAEALWRRVQLNVLSVRRFREEKKAPGRERTAVHELLGAMRRFNRVLRRLSAADIPGADSERVARALRRTGRLVERRLTALRQPA
jgi:ParB family chromosome partitioning protein